MSTNLSSNGVGVEDLSSSSGATAVANTSWAGTRAGTEIAAQVAMDIRYLIARRYRGGKPKGFWPFGVQADQVDVSHWVTAFASTSATDFAAFITAIVGAGWAGAGTLTHVNVSYYAGFTAIARPPFRTRNVNTLRPGGPITDLVTGYQADTQFGSQRRRRAAA
jgi:hypothetical protein